MAEHIFTSSQSMMAKHLYAILSSMTPEQLDGAVMALTTLNVLAEDGYLSLNSKALEVDFYVHCYDVMIGTSLCMKMLNDDGLIPDNAGQVVKDFNPSPYLKEADLALIRVEHLMKLIGKTPETTQ